MTTTCHSDKAGAATPLTPGVQAAIATLRRRMEKEKCSYDRAFIKERNWLRRQKCGDGMRSAWTDMAEDFEAAYRILAAEAKL